MKLLLAIGLTSLAMAAEPVRDFYLMKSGGAPNTFEFRLVEEKPQPGFRRVVFHELAYGDRELYVAPGALMNSRDLESVQVMEECGSIAEEPYHGVSVTFRKDRRAAIEKRLASNIDRRVGVFTRGKLIVFATLRATFSKAMQVCGARGTLEDARLLARDMAGAD